MILVRRGTLVVMLVIAAALGVGVGSWGASAVDPAKHPDPAPPQQQLAMRAPVVPAALPVASGSFAQVAEAVGPAVVNITTFMRSGGGRTPVEEFFGDELLRRFFGEGPERPQQQDGLPFHTIHLPDIRRSLELGRAFRFPVQLVHALSRAQHAIDRAHRQHARGVREDRRRDDERQHRERILRQ